jgi:hypothetical protein
VEQEAEPALAAHNPGPNPGYSPGPSNPSPEPSQEAGEEDAPGRRLSPTPLIIGVLVIAVLGTFFVGVYPFPILEAIDAATGVILPGGG